MFLNIVKNCCAKFFYDLSFLKLQFLTVSRGGSFFAKKKNLMVIRRYLCDYLELKEKSNIYGYVLFEICSFPGSFCSYFMLLWYLEGILGAPIKYFCSKLDFFGSSTQISSFWYHKSVQIPCNNMLFHVTILFLKPTEVLKPIGNVWEVEIHPFRHVGRKNKISWYCEELEV